MTEQELFDAFLEFEDKNDLFNRNYNGFYYWIYIRYEVYSRIIEVITQSGPILLPNNYCEFKTISNVFKNITLELFCKKKRKAEILLFQLPRKSLENDKYIDLYTNFLNENLSQEFISIDSVNIQHRYVPLKHKCEKWNIPHLAAKIKSKFIKIKDVEVIHCINSLQEHISVTFNVKLPKNHIFNIVNKFYVYHKTLCPFYLKKLQEIKPKVVIQVCYYTPKNMILNEVSSLLNIPTIELQHGTMGLGHLAYNYKRKVKYPQLPKYMYLFSQFWKDCSLLPLADENIKITGFPYFESQLNKFKDINESKASNEKKIILFISQTTIGKELSRFAVELSKLIDPKKYEIIYKLHPIESSGWETRLSELYLSRENITVISNNKENLYSIFSRSHIQVGVYSTAVYEGLGFNLKTFIVPLRGYASMKTLINMNYATLVQNPLDLFNNLDSHTPSVDKENFWKKDSVNNIISNINTIIF